jgi:hypothetical protein
VEEVEVSEEQRIAEAQKREGLQRLKELDELKLLLEYRQFRNFMWRVLSHASVFESIWNEGPRIHYNSGRQDFGHWLLDEVTKA